MGVEVKYLSQPSPTDLSGDSLLQKDNSIMNFVGILSRVRTSQGRRIHTLVKPQWLTPKNNSSQSFRRSLINSAETGGIVPKTSPLVIGWNMKLPALGGLVLLAAFDAKCFLDEDGLSAMFGTAWNWGMIATIVTIPVAAVLLFVLLAATINFGQAIGA